MATDFIVQFARRESGRVFKNILKYLGNFFTPIQFQLVAHLDEVCVHGRDGEVSKLDVTTILSDDKWGRLAGVLPFDVWRNLVSG